MNLKRTALKGALILTIVIALCLFFSQTIITITTPKVKLVTAKRGKLEQKFSVTGELYYPTSEAFTIDQARNFNATVLAIYVRPGDEVKAGDLLFTTRIASTSDDVLKRAEEDLQKALDAQLKTIVENNKRTPKDTRKNEAERALVAAREALIEAQRALIKAAHGGGLELSTDIGEWQAAISEKGDSELQDLYKKVETATTAQDEALADFLMEHKRGGSDASYTLVKKLEDDQKAVDAAREEVLRLQLEMESLLSVRAPRGGVLVSLDVAPGETCPGEKSAFTLAASRPVIRADIAEIRKELQKGMEVEIKQEYMTIKTTITDIKRESSSKKYAIIEITEEMLNEYGGYRGLGNEQLPIKIQYTAKTATSLLPANAVRDDGGSAYVFVVEDSSSFWGQEKKLRKQDVHVIERSDALCSIEEELYAMSIADGEDRPIKEGSRVMEYLD